MKRINYGEIHDMLASQLEEIYSNKMEGVQLETEIKKASAMTGLATQIINLGKLQLSGAKQFGKDDNIEKLYIEQ